MKNIKAWARKLERVLKEAPDGVELFLDASSGHIEVWRWSEEIMDDRKDSPVVTFLCPVEFTERI